VQYNNMTVFHNKLVGDVNNNFLIYWI